jgi:hypothetical protein
VNTIILETITSFIKESETQLKKRGECIYPLLKQYVTDLAGKELSLIDAGKQEVFSERYDRLRAWLGKLKDFLEDGYFRTNYWNEVNRLEALAKEKIGVDVDKNTYKRGDFVRKIGQSKDIKVYKAQGNDILFRAVSLKDWLRINFQQKIDSDMRGAISEEEGINLAQSFKTALYYLPHGSEGVIMAIDPKGLDLYMLDVDSYIRSFRPILLKNVIWVSPVIRVGSSGDIVSSNVEEDFNKMLIELKKLGFKHNC